jgi:hypothetical protein
MALMEIVKAITLEAGGDLSADQFKFVTLAADNQVDVEASATDMPTGVLLNNPSAAGQACEVAVGGIVKVIAGTGGLTVGGNVTTDGSGGAVAAVATDSIVGIAMSTAAAGELVEVMFDYRGLAV